MQTGAIGARHARELALRRYHLVSSAAMSSPHPAGSGRHRGSARPTTVFSRLWRRPSHRSALKGLGLAASALGVATAFAAPAPGASFELTAAEVQQPAAIARAET